MKKPGIINFEVIDNIYHLCVVFVIGDSKDVIDYINKKYNAQLGYDYIHPNDDACQFTLCNHREAQRFFVWLNKYNNTPEGIGLLTHETLHATLDCMRYIGQDLTPDTEEAYTYYQQHLIEKFLINFKNAKGKQRKNK